MIGFLIGFVGGVIEFLLLKRLTVFIIETKVKRAIGFFLLKLLVYALVLTATGIWFRDQLLYCGLGLVGVILICSLVYFLFMKKKVGTNNNE